MLLVSQLYSDPHVTPQAIPATEGSYSHEFSEIKYTGAGLPYVSLASPVMTRWILFAPHTI